MVPMKPRTGGVYVPVPAPSARHSALPNAPSSPLTVTTTGRWGSNSPRLRTGSRRPSQREGTQVCPIHNIALPLSGVCDQCLDET